MYDDIRYETDHGIALLTIDRPSVHNAFTETTIEELNDGLERFQDNDSAYVLVLTGADGSFCAGADVSSMPDWSEGTESDYADFLRNVQNVVRQLRNTPKPTVAAVAGPAIGAGFDFALACDIRIMDSEGFFRQGFVNVGLVPGDGGAWLLPRLIGESRAREYLLTGRDIPAEEALEVGLAASLTEDPLDEAMSFAENLRGKPALAVRRTNQLVDPQQSFEEYCEQAIDYQWECVNDEEHEEAIQAFIEGRDPTYDREYT